MNPPVFLRGCQILGVALALGLAGCGRAPESSEHAGHDEHAAGGHAHEAKYGGQLVELGEHEGNVEFVLDPAAGKVTAYILDAHAENFVRLPLESFRVVALVGGGEQTLVFRPVGNASTGEKPGDTSQFESAAEWLKTTPAFSAKIIELPVRGKTFREVPVKLPK